MDAAHKTTFARKYETAGQNHPLKFSEHMEGVPPQIQLRAPLALRHLQNRLQRPSLLRSDRTGQSVEQSLFRRLARGRDPLRQRCQPGQQYRAGPQPRDRGDKQGLRPLPTGPRPRIQPLSQLGIGRSERGIPVALADLPLMLQPRLLPLPVPLQTRRIRHPHLARHIIDHHTRRLQHIGREQPQMTHPHQQQREPEPVVITTMQRHQRTISIIEEEEPLQRLLIRRPARIPAIRRALSHRQKRHRHGRST